MDEFPNAVAMITGAASGIGAALASRLAQGGAKKLILIDRDEDRLRDFAFSLPCERQLIVGDVTDETLWNNADLTGLTHAAVNAGVGAGAPITDTSFAEWRRIVAINLDGAFLTLQAAMRAIKAGGTGGSIVVTASAAGIRAEPNIAAYGASKAAVIHLTRIAAREGAADRIRVNSIAPGGVETAIWSSLPFFQDLILSTGSEEAAFEAMGKAAAPQQRFAKAEEIAEQMAFLLSDSSAYVTGSCFVSDGGYSL